MKDIRKSILITFLFCATYMISWSQASSFVLLKDGTRIDNPQKIYQSGLYFTVTNSSGKKKTYPQKKLKAFRMEGLMYISLPMKLNGRELLMRVVAFTDEHILLSYKEEVPYLHMYVYTRDYEIVEPHFDMHPSTKESQLKENIENLKNKIVPYFGDCEDLITILTNNINTGNDAHDGLSLISCGEASIPELKK